MNTLYRKALDRLSAYRIKNHISQKRMGSMMGITQSHYSKVEQGKKRLSGAALVSLSSFDVDVDFVLTGEETLVTELNDYLRACKDEYRDELLQQMVWLVNRGTDLMDKREEWGSVDYIREAELFRMKAHSERIRESIWYGIRRLNHYTQVEMADILDVNIKKYRDIEKENRIPDAEVIINLYEKTGILPSVLLEGEVSNLNILNHVWQQFAPGVKKELLEVLDKACGLFPQAAVP